jgi:hypothetical protein
LFEAKETERREIDPADSVRRPFRTSEVGIAKLGKAGSETDQDDQDMARRGLLQMYVWRKLGLFDARHLIGVHGTVAWDRNVFACHEAFIVEMKAYLVVAVAFRIVKVPLSARLAPQPADPVFFARTKAAHTASRLMRLPFGGIEASIAVQWSEEIIAFLGVSHGMALFAGKQQPNMPKFWGNVFQIGHLGDRELF